MVVAVRSLSSDVHLAITGVGSMEELSGLEPI